WDAAAAVACGVVLSLHVVTEPMLAVAAIAFGVARAALAHPPSPPTGAAPALPPVPFLLGAGGAAIAGLVRTFAPIGIVTFGGGLAMIPAIERAVVLEQHLIGPHTFADAIALGQITPGPVAICATFIGYRVGGVAGALASTVAMFGPAIALAIAVGRSVDRFRENPFVASALRALAPAVIGMLIAATVSLTRTGVDDLLGAAVAAGALVLLTAARVSPLWALAGGGLVRLLVSLRG
ncbi:MAG TPA: chromate transporter, partial [Byssovorax sp.]